MAWALGLASAALALALSALWVSFVTGILTRPSSVSLIPAALAMGCVWGALAAARRVWRSGRRVVAAVSISLATLAAAGALLAGAAWFAYTEPPPPPPSSVPWSLWRC